MYLFLNQAELSHLRAQDPSSRSKGGFQGLLVALQDQTDFNSGRIFLTPKQTEKIQRYAFKYGHGGWEKLLASIFSRTLGKRLSGYPLTSIPKVFIDA